MLPMLSEHFTIQTTRPIQGVVSKLEDVIEPKQFLRAFRAWQPGQKPYEGSVEPEAFSAYPVTDFQKSFVPVIKGKITQATGGCSISITLRPNTGLLIFTALWVGSLGFVFLSALWRLIETLLQSGLREAPPFLQLGISAGMLMVGYGLLSGSYKKQAANTQRFFRLLLDEHYVEAGEEDLELLNED